MSIISLEEEGLLKVKAMNIIFVLDSYDTDSIQRIDYYQAVLQTLCTSFSTYLL
jgi:hypothetical protein